MQYSAGTATFIDGSQVATFDGADVQTYFVPGQIISPIGSNVWYQVGSVHPTLPQITMVEPYVGDGLGGTDADIPYVLQEGYTANFDFPYPEQGDVETASVVKRAIIKIDEALTGFGVAALVAAGVTFGAAGGAALAQDTVNFNYNDSTNTLNVANVNVTGTMTVANTVTINSSVVTIDDPVFTLGGDTAPVSDDNKDRGIEFRYYSGSAKRGFFGWDDSISAFTFIADATNTAEVFSGTPGSVVFGPITGTTGTFSGALTAASIAATNSTLSGTLTAAAIVGGTVSGSTGTFSGALTSTTAAHSGTLSADSVTTNFRFKADATAAKDGALIATSAGLLSLGHWTAPTSGINLSPADNIMIGSTTDDTVNKWQLTGAGKVTGNFTVTGTLTSGAINGLTLGSGTITGLTSVVITGTADTSVFRVASAGDGLRVIPRAGGSGARVDAVNNANSAYTPLLVGGLTTDIHVNGTITASLIAGALGVGVTPIAVQTGYASIQVGGTGSGVTAANADVYLHQNANVVGAVWTRKASGLATYYNQSSGTHTWATAVTGASGSTITWVNSMALTVSGLTVSAPIIINDATAGNLYLQKGGTTRLQMRGDDSTSIINALQTAGVLAFQTNDVERARVTSTGFAVTGLVTSTGEIQAGSNVRVVSDGTVYSAANALKLQGQSQVTIQVSGATDVATFTTSGFTALNTLNANSTASNLRLKADGTSAKDGAIVMDSAGVLWIGHWAGQNTRITAADYFKSSNTGSFHDSASNNHEFWNGSNAGGAAVCIFSHAAATATNQYGVGIFLRGDPNTSTNYGLAIYGGAGVTLRAELRANGGLANFSANNVNLSTILAKRSFQTLAANDSLYDQIWNAHKIVNWGRWKYRDQTHNDWNWGPSAEGVRAAFEDCAPELVGLFDERRGLLGVYEADLHHIGHAVLAKAQYRVETLEEKVKRLEAWQSHAIVQYPKLALAA